MPYYQSNLGYIGIGEKQRTTALSTPAIFIPVTEESLNPIYDELHLDEPGQGLYAGSTKWMKTRKYVDVAFSSYLYPESGAELTAAFMGKSTFTAAAVTTTNVHTMGFVATRDQLTTPQQPWMTIERSLGMDVTPTSTVVVERFKGVKFSSLTLEGEAGQPVKITMEGKGRDAEIVSTPATDTYETNNPFMFFNGQGRYIVDNPTSAFTTTTINIKSFNVKLNMNNDQEMQTDGFADLGYTPQTRSAEITVGVYFQDYWNYVHSKYGHTTTQFTTTAFGAISTSYYESEGALEIDLYYGNALTTTMTAALRRYTLRITKMKLMPHELHMANVPETMIEELSGIALKKNTTTELWNINVSLPMTTSLPL